MPPLHVAALGAVCRRPSAGLAGHHTSLHCDRDGAVLSVDLATVAIEVPFAPAPQSTMAALPPMAFAPGSVPPLDLALDDIIKMHKKKKKAPVRSTARRCIAE